VVLLHGLGVTQFLVAVNKLDAANPPWCQDQFKHIHTTVLTFVKDSRYRERNVTFVHVSGLTGINVNREEDGGGEGRGGQRGEPEGMEDVEEVVQRSHVSGSIQLFCPLQAQV
jgi:sulfate adenylyltransferase subunit 1 (EFTu-like GTPase family)